MGIVEYILKNINTDKINSASAMARFAAEAEEIEEAERQKESIRMSQVAEQIRLLTEQNAKLDESCQELKSQNEKLQMQIDCAMKSEQEAKKETKHARLWTYITVGIAVASLIAAVFIAIFK